MERECTAGRSRIDLAIEYARQWHVLEIKLIRAHDSPTEVRTEGLAQIRRYRDRIAPITPAYLFLFDRRSETKTKPWGDRIGWETVDTIRIVRC